MDATEANQQWKVCKFCGTKMVYGDYAKGVIRRMVERGDTQEEAEAYVYGRTNTVYLECPGEEGHQGVGMVPLEELEHGAYYHGACRNATFARWNAEKQYFVYMREKCGNVRPEEIGYWIEAKPGEHRFDEFRPYGRMEEPLFEIPMTAW